MELILSIITPTFNREYTLIKLYNSLKRQTDLNFEWIIVDDGSTDNTLTLCNSFIEDNYSFPIYYLHQENRGKHCALNLGIKQAKTDFVFIVDSDDELVENSIEIVNKWLHDIGNNRSIAGVAGLRGYKSTLKRIGDFPVLKKKAEYIECKNTMRRKYNLLGDKAEIYRTSILREYPFFEFENENFLTEDTVWNEIAYQGYSVRWYNEIIYLCEYLEDGLTKSGEKKEIVNYCGFTYSVLQRIKCCSKLDGIIALGKFVDISKKRNMQYKEMKNTIQKSEITLFLSYIVWNLKNIVSRGLNL